jgi:hypothetical protein
LTVRARTAGDSGLTGVQDIAGRRYHSPALKIDSECKDEGYEEFGFENQWQCIASVQTVAKGN